MSHLLLSHYFKVHLSDRNESEFEPEEPPAVGILSGKVSDIDVNCVPRSCFWTCPFRRTCWRMPGWGSQPYTSVILPSLKTMSSSLGSLLSKWLSISRVFTMQCYLPTEKKTKRLNANIKIRIFSYECFVCSFLAAISISAKMTP